VAGSLNKTSATVKAAIEAAAKHLASQPKGSGKPLNEWAMNNTDDFYKLLYPKLLPLQVNHGDNEGGKLYGWLPPQA